MDTIPIAPAPQHNAPSAKTPRGAAGAATESGFDQALKQATADDSAKQAPGQSDRNTEKQPPSTDDSAKQAPAQSERNTEKQTPPVADRAIAAAVDKVPAQNKGQTALEEAAPADLADASSAAIAAGAGQSLLALLFGRSAQAVGPQPMLASWHTPAGPILNQALQTSPEAGAPNELPAAVNNGLTVTFENGTKTMVPAATGRQMDALLGQLQALITANNDQVRVTASLQSADRATLPGFLSGPLVDALSAGPNAPIAQQAKLITGLPGEQPVISVDALLQKNSDVPVTSLRQEQAGSELHSRLAIFQNNSGEQKNEQGGRQQSMQHQATAGQQATTTLLPQVEANGTTSHGFTTQFQEAATQQAAAASRLSGQPSSAPGGQHVAEGDVIGQIIQRFSLQTNLQTSRLNLKLHPAELGELKISLVVKEDSLKANIYAQTRQAQEIIEKHLPRLKTILEEQGLVVEDLLVTLESEFLEDSTSQQGQSFAEQMTDFGREQGGQGNNDLFRNSLEEVPVTSAEHDPHAPSGVNLTV